MKWQTKIRFIAGKKLDLHPIEQERNRLAFTEWKWDLLDAIFPVARAMNVSIQWAK